MNDPDAGPVPQTGIVAGPGAEAAAPADPGREAPDHRVDRRLLDFLVCPITRGPLVLVPEAQELVSHRAGLAFPIVNGIPVMLLDEARQLED